MSITCPDEETLRVSGSRLALPADVEIPPGFAVIREGCATVLFPLSTTQNIKAVPGSTETTSTGTFYNKAQVVNRDLSVLVLRQFQRLLASESTSSKLPYRSQLRIVEPLSASGLRGVRYWLEVPGIEWVVCGDMSPQAFNNMKRNFEFNRVASPSDGESPSKKPAVGAAAVGAPDIDSPPSRMLAGCVSATHGDANDVLRRFRCVEPARAADLDTFAVDGANVVDLDPYGTAAPFFDAAVEAIADGGLMCVTCTDMAVLCGVQSAACYSKYSAIPMKNVRYIHESAVRIVIGSLSQRAALRKRSIEPLISLHIDFYVRIFVRVTKIRDVRVPTDSIGFASGCKNCPNHYLYPMVPREPNTGGKQFTVPAGECNCCGSRMNLAGPMWRGLLHSHAFINGILDDLAANSSHFDAAQRVSGLLRNAADELPNPFFWDLPHLSRSVRSNGIPVTVIRTALHHLGYRTSGNHFVPDSIKTDAPGRVIMEIMRQWARYILSQRDKADTSGFYTDLSKPPPSFPRDLLEGPDAFSTPVHQNQYQDAILAVSGPKDFYAFLAADSSQKLRSGTDSRFPLNPKNWGPAARSRVTVASAEDRVPNDFLPGSPPDEAGCAASKNPPRKKRKDQDH